ncbi:MAG: class I SAM-dependent methyltransferase [Pseudomonadota bacterium]
MNDFTVNRFRQKRGQILQERIEDTAKRLGRKLRILDVGGREDYWENVDTSQIEHISLMNYDPAELERGATNPDLFSKEVGDARDLTKHADGSIDFVHSNSVIEHVGHWGDMASMAKEVVRVGQAGWIQTPAWEFPVEPHFRTLFMHWFGAPAQRAMFSLSFSARLRKLSFEKRRAALDGVNLLSYREVKELFPGKDIYIERLLIAKSYSVYWLPEG